MRNVVRSVVLCLAFALAAPAHADASRLVGAWGFDEGAGTTTKDASGFGNNGVTANTAWTTGKHGGALSFNGESSLVSVPDAATLDIPGAVTIEAWVLPTTLAGRGAPLS